MSDQRPAAASGLRIGLVGCGNWGRHILRDLTLLGCRVAVAARSEEARANAAERAATVVPSVGRLPEVDGIVVATPTTTHSQVVEQVLGRGVPLFVEKPLTADSSSADRLLGAAADRLFVMDKWRYHPGVELLGRIARSGELGPVVGLATTRIGWGNPHADVDAVWILAPHDLAIGLEILGRLLPPLAAVADRSHGGAVTGMTALLGARPWHSLEVSSRSPVCSRRVTLRCRDGIAVLTDGYSDHVEIHRQPDPFDTGLQEPERRPISTEPPLLRELRAFIEHLAGGPPPRSSAAEGAAAIATIEHLRLLGGID